MEEQIDVISGTQKKQKPRKGAAAETLYRVTLRNQLNAISIADQKANIIIGINTILISIVMAVFGTDPTLQRLEAFLHINLLIPFSIMLATCFASAIVAVFVVRPLIKPWKDDYKGKVFFKDYKKQSLDQFQEEMMEVLKSSSSIYEHMNTDMYLSGRAVIRKYRLLRIAYHIFLAGFVLAVFSFLFLQFVI
jgi:hypothetical protein